MQATPAPFAPQTGPSLKKEVIGFLLCLVPGLLLLLGMFITNRLNPRPTYPDDWNWRD